MEKTPASMFEDDAVVLEGNDAEKANEEEELDDDPVSHQTERLPVVLRIPNTCVQ